MEARQIARHAPLAASAALLVWHALTYGFVTDDAFISFVYSRNLAEHGELVFNAGMDPVEGYTNFLWTVVLGLLMLVGLAPEVTSIALGIGFAIGTLVVVHRMSARIWDGASAWDHLAPALLAATAGYACWSAGGLETQMFTFWVVLGLHFYARGDEDGRALRRAGPVLALAAMTRPEGLLVAAVLGLHRVGFMVARDRRIRPTRDELLCVAYFLAPWAPYFAWRWWYYGYPFPNTYYVKAAGPAAAGYEQKLRANGLYYVWQFLRDSGLRWGGAVALVGLLAPPLRSRRFYAGTAAFAIIAVYLPYVVSVGGDFMGLHRFVMPLFPLGALGVACGLRLLVRLACRTRPRALRVAAPAAAAALLIAHGASQALLTRRSLRRDNLDADHGIDTPAYLRMYTHDRAVLGQLMEPCFRDDDFVIYGGAGAKPYYAGARGIDVFGLVSERIAHEVPRNRPRAGHNKWAPDALLVQHDPSFIFSCYSLHPDPKKPMWNCNPAALERKGYDRVTLRVPGLWQAGASYYSFMVKKERLATLDCPGRMK